ncbi:MAG TPA: hypothetical protein VFK11_02850 [Candidatus Saccharimonadales bacterium]|nr:hypothetical protein [Candidatus Saccharimonadales bacterium]
MENNDNKEQKPAKSYGKRPVWQWVLIYIVAGIVVYGLIYYFFIKDNGNSGNNTGGFSY